MRLLIFNDTVKFYLIWEILILYETVTAKPYENVAFNILYLLQKLDFDTGTILRHQQFLRTLPDKATGVALLHVFLIHSAHLSLDRIF